MKEVLKKSKKNILDNVTETKTKPYIKIITAVLCL